MPMLFNSHENKLLEEETRNWDTRMHARRVRCCSGVSEKCYFRKGTEAEIDRKKWRATIDEAKRHLHHNLDLKYLIQRDEMLTGNRRGLGTFLTVWIFEFFVKVEKQESFSWASKTQDFYGAGKKKREESLFWL